MTDKTGLLDWRRLKMSQSMQRKEFPAYLLYLSRKESFEDIIKSGILPLNETKKKNLLSGSFADADVQERRERKSYYFSDAKSYNLHDVVPLYFKAKTPTLSVRRDQQENLFFCKVSPLKLISDPKIAFAFTDGNAASDITSSYYDLKKLDKLKWKVIHAEFWNDHADGKRIRNSEFLIFPKIEIKYIFEFSVNNQKLKEKFKNILLKNSIKIPVLVDEGCFFTT